MCVCALCVCACCVFYLCDRGSSKVIFTEGSSSHVVEQKSFKDTDSKNSQQESFKKFPPSFAFFFFFLICALLIPLFGTKQWLAALACIVGVAVEGLHTLQTAQTGSVLIRGLYPSREVSFVGRWILQKIESKPASPVTAKDGLAFGVFPGRVTAIPNCWPTLELMFS